MNAASAGRLASATIVNLPVADLKRSIAFFEVLVALQLASRVDVDEVTQKAFAAGGKDFRPAEDHGWMYGRAFQDLDGHIWEPFFMDVQAMQAATLAAES